MKYSFLLPAYKSQFFEQALVSILSQTYPDFNIFVSDDCSPEDLKSIVDKFNDPRIKYRRNRINIGGENLVDHWNMLLNLTNAEFIIMASDDDVYDPGFLESIDQLTKKYPQVNVFRPRIKKIDNQGLTICEEAIIQQYLSLNEYLSLWSNQNLYSGISYYVFNRQALILNGGFENFPFAWFSDDASVIKQIGENGLVVSDKLLFSFRSSDYSISSQKDIHCLYYKLKAANLFYRFLNRYKKTISGDIFTKVCHYIQFTAKNDFFISGAPLSIAIYAFLTASYASLRWKMSLIKISKIK